MGLRRRHSRERRQRGSTRCQMQKSTAWKPSGFPASVGPLSLSVRSVSPHMYRNGCGLARLSQLRNNVTVCIRLAEAARHFGTYVSFHRIGQKMGTLDGHAACEGQARIDSLVKQLYDI